MMMLQLHLILIHLDMVLTETYCSSQGCKDVAKILEENMNTKVKPCENFYQYACGGYIDKHAGNDSAFQREIVEKIEDRLMDMLDENVGLSSLPIEVLTVVRDMYAQCMNLDEEEEQGFGDEWAKEVQRVMDDMADAINLVGIPLFTKTECNYSPQDFAILLAESHKGNMFYYTSESRYSLASPVLFTPLVVSKSSFFPQTIIQIGFNEEDYVTKNTQDEKVDGFYHVIKEYAQDATGVQIDNEGKVKDELKKIVDFEHTLYDNLGYGNRKRITYKELKEQLAYVLDLELYFKRLMPHEFHNYLENYPEQEIDIRYHGYITKLPQLLKDTTCAVKYNYIFYKLIEGNYVLKTMSESDCVKVLLLSPLKQALTAVYIDQYYGDPQNWNKKQEMKAWSKDLQEISLSIRSAMESMIASADWILDKNTRAAGVNKLQMMKIDTEISTLFTSEKLLAQFYANLKFDSMKSYFENRREHAKWFMHRMMSRLDSNSPLFCIKDAWYLQNALTRGAFNNLATNQVYIPPGIIQHPLYRIDYPTSYKFGGLGNIIGHEITHGFDELGRFYDRGGSVANWWDKTSEDQFINKAECFIRQYNGMLVEQVNVHINGDHTVGENIADNGGIRAAFRGYQRWQQEYKSHLQEPTIRVKNKLLTPNELFFLSAAQWECAAFTDPALKIFVETSTHSPPEYRINIPFKNFEDFSDVFKCGNGSYMNPVDKCRIW